MDPLDDVNEAEEDEEDGEKGGKLLSAECKTLLRCIVARRHYGGMACDAHMLRSLGKLWRLRLAMQDQDQHKNTLPRGLASFIHCPALRGTPLRSWRTQRVNDMAVTPDGATLLTSSSERRVRAWDVSTGAEVVDGGIAEAEAVVSMSLSRAGDRLLLNLANQQLHAWRLPPGLAGRGAARRGELGTDAASPPPAADAPSPDPAPCAVYRGAPPRAGRFVVRSCFGGVDDGFVASGSEACAVFVWRAATGALLHTLPGHSGTVNAVAWNPADPAMLVSASDDRSVHVWGLPGDARARAEAGDAGADGAGDAGDGVSL
jgi:hypothetical protein